MGEQRLHNGWMPLGDGPHQRRLVLRGLGGVHVRTVREQRRHGLRVPRAGAAHQDGLARRHGGPRIGACRQQEIHHLRVRVGAGERQRDDAVRVGGPGVCAPVDQQASRLDVVEIGGPVQRGRAVRLRRVHVDGGIQQAPHCPSVLQLDRVDETQVSGLRARVTRSEQENADDGEQRPDTLPNPTA